MGAIRERLFPSGRPGVDATALESALVYGTIWLGLFLVGYPVYLLTLESGLIDTTDARGLLGSDFVAFWSGARLAALGQVDILADAAAFARAQIELIGVGDFSTRSWCYPPSMLLFLAPFGALPYKAGFFLWATGGIAAFAAATLSGLSRADAMRGAAILSPIVLANVMFGNNGLYTAALAIGAFRVMDRSPALAGAMLAALAQKPHLGLTIALLLVLHREWRTIGATLAAAAGLLALSLALHGARPWIDWVEVVLPYQASLMAVTDDYLPHLLMMSTWFVGLRVMFAPEGLAGAVHALGVALTLGFVAFAALRRSRETGRIVTLIAAPGVSPYLFIYDLGVLTGALWLALVHRAPRPDRSRLLVAGLNLPILSFALASASYILSQNFGLQGPILQIGPPIILCLTGWAALRMEPAARPSPLDATQAPAALPLGAQAAA
jgi:hypothetical protein